MMVKDFSALQVFPTAKALENALFKEQSRTSNLILRILAINIRKIMNKHKHASNLTSSYPINYRNESNLLLISLT